MSLLEDKMMRAFNRLTKWRSTFTGWQLGTRPIGDPESDAVRDHREVTILLRAEYNTLLGLCLEKGVFTLEEFQERAIVEADLLSKQYEEKFPGFSANDHGMSIDPAKALITTKGWKP